MKFLGKRYLHSLLTAAVLFSFSVSSYAEESGSGAQAPQVPSLQPSSAGGNGSGSNTVLPDLFTGTMSYKIPIEVPPGRNGMDPGLALLYRSSNGNGLVGMGWELEVGAIERSTRNGVKYDDTDTYLFRMAGATIELVSIGVINGVPEYRAKIEGAFNRFKKLISPSNIPYWEVTDKKGTKYTFGYFYNNTGGAPSLIKRVPPLQYDPNDSTRIFKWCLNRVEDTNSNYMTFTYFHDQGQIYLDHIDYAGNGSLSPSNQIYFYLEDRTDAPIMYTTNFAVKTAKRLGKIDVLANGSRVRTYKLNYATNGSSSTGRSLLTNVQQFDKDGTAMGNALPAMTLDWTEANGFEDKGAWISGAYGNWDGSAGRIRPMDVNGDYKMDIVIGPDNLGKWYVLITGGQYPDMLSSVSNGLGATTAISYLPSTAYSNTQLPFPIQTLYKTVTTDGNGVRSETKYGYSGGFYHIGDKDFRGFNYVRAVGPYMIDLNIANPYYMIKETWFHQGNDTAIDVNNPYDLIGYMKGKPYRATVKGKQGLSSFPVYSETTISYDAVTSGPSYFNPPLQVETSICDGDACGKKTRVVYKYDPYGNVTEEKQHGDVSITTDDRTIARSFGFNETAWIVGLPTNEVVYEGIWTSGEKKAETIYYYDGATDCDTASDNQIPNQGKLTRIVRWNSDGASPEIRMAYDSYGNLKCSKAPNEKTITTFDYDSGTHTFLKTVTNPLGYKTTTQYIVDPLAWTDQVRAARQGF